MTYVEVISLNIFETCLLKGVSIGFHSCQKLSVQQLSLALYWQRHISRTLKDVILEVNAHLCANERLFNDNNLQY